MGRIKGVGSFVQVAPDVEVHCLYSLLFFSSLLSLFTIWITTERTKGGCFVLVNRRTGSRVSLRARRYERFRGKHSTTNAMSGFARPKREDISSPRLRSVQYG